MQWLSSVHATHSLVVVSHAGVPESAQSLLATQPTQKSLVVSQTSPSAQSPGF
jgi:hypothetical protein